MKNKCLILILVLLVLSLNSAFAGNPLRTGTAGALELRIPVGSRGTAMGGTVVADVTGVESIFWNPAGLAFTQGTEVMFTHQPYLADIDVNFFGVATSIEDFGTIGVGIKIVSIGDMEETTETYPDGTGRIFSPTLSVMSLSYSKVLTSNVSFGFTGMFVNERIFEANASGMAFDVGISFDPGWHGLSMGMVIKNYGPEMEFSGKGFLQSIGDRPGSGVSASFDIPSTVNLGMSYKAYNQDNNMFKVNGNFVANNFGNDIWQGGGEYTYDDMLSLRAGYTHSAQESYLYGFSWGLGFHYDMFTIDYAWKDAGSIFDANQYFTLKALF